MRIYSELDLNTFEAWSGAVNTLDRIRREGNVAEFTEVEALDDVRTQDGKEFCTKKLKIGSKLSLSQFIEAIFNFVSQNIKSQAEVSDGETLIGGGYAELVGGNDTTLVGGNNTKLVGGDYAKLVGDNDATLAGGKNAVIVGDHGSAAKGKKGSIIVLIERDSDLNIVNFKAVQVDGKKLKRMSYISSKTVNLWR